MVDSVESTLRPILRAAKKMQWKSVWFYLDAAANYMSTSLLVNNILDDEEYGLIHHAAIHGNTEALCMLVVVYEADIGLRTKGGAIGIADLAAKHQHAELCSLIRSLTTTKITIDTAQLASFKWLAHEMRSKPQKMADFQELQDTLDERLEAKDKELRKQREEFEWFRSCVDDDRQRVIQEAHDELSKAQLIAKDIVARLLAERKERHASVHKSDDHSGGSADEIVWMIVSTPIVGRDGTDVMGELQELRKSNANFVLAYDWPGSANSKDADVDKWELMKPHLKAWVKSGFKDDDSFSTVRAILYSTLWYHIFAGMVKGHVRALMQSDERIDLKCVLIEGGPVSRCEAFAMPMILHDSVLELETLGVMGSSIRLVQADTVQSLKLHMLKPCLEEVAVGTFRELVELRRATSSSPSSPTHSLSSFSCQQIRQVSEVFRTFDSSKDGYLDLKELKALLQRLDGKWSKGDAASKLYAQIDKDATGKIELDELMTWIFAAGDANLTILQGTQPSPSGGGSKPVAAKAPARARANQKKGQFRW